MQPKTYQRVRDSGRPMRRWGLSQRQRPEWRQQASRNRKNGPLCLIPGCVDQNPAIGVGEQKSWNLTLQPERLGKLDSTPILSTPFSALTLIGNDAAAAPATWDAKSPTSGF